MKLAQSPDTAYGQVVAELGRRDRRDHARPVKPRQLLLLDRGAVGQLEQRRRDLGGQLFELLGTGVHRLTQ